MNNFDVVVIGGGPAGLASATTAHKNGAKTLLIEREQRLGGILKQCVHDGFGLIRYNKKMTGPEYATHEIREFEKQNIEFLTLTFVTKILKTENGFEIFYVNRQGAKSVKTKKIILATGCRERTAKQVFIHGTRPSGVFTAGCCQNFVNLEGMLPTKHCVILGSGDIGLIMARRLTLEGAKVLGVYEAKDSPSGLMRNISQCLNDFDIPLYLSHTVTKTFGEDRLTAVEVSKVDKNMQKIDGTEQIVECDALILSVGLIPENELAETLDVEIDKNTKGAKCDGQFMTTIENVYTCGNSTHVNDLVDYVSKSGEIAGLNASILSENKRQLVDIEINSNVLYCVPNMLNINTDNSKINLFFRSKFNLNNSKLIVKIDDAIVFSKNYANLKPPEMESVIVDFSIAKKNSKICVEILPKGEL